MMLSQYQVAPGLFPHPLISLYPSSSLITQPLFTGDPIGFIVALIGQLGGVMNGLGWITVAIWLFLALGLGYFRFLSSDLV